MWRPAVDGAVEVAVVHRPRYDDWSLPKGKVDPGEARVTTAVREVAEETGYAVTLGRFLGRTTYDVDGHDKHVDHWCGRAVGGRFAANDEVDDLRWVPVSEAQERVTRASDADVLERFAALPVDTSTLLLVRHAKAGRRKDFRGNDAQRPLAPGGRLQAQALVAVCRAFGVTAVHSADRVRCTQTVEPLAVSLGVEVLVEPMLSEEGYAADPVAAALRVRQLTDSGGTPVVCSQGGVIPDLVAHWAGQAGIDLPSLRTRKASTWVLSSVDGKMVAADHLPDPFD